MTKPNLFIVGAPKCGTTAWVEYLRAHPAVFFPTIKEPHHFSTDFPEWVYFADQSDYLHLFKEGASAAWRGDGSVWYLYSAVAAKNIKRFSPNSKILIFTRDQRDYLPSLHNQNLYNGDECLMDFGAAWALSGVRPSSTIPRSCREPKFLDYKALGRFDEQVGRFIAAFGAEQVRVFDFADWIGNPRATYVGILHFLGLEDDGRCEFHRVNAAAHHRSQILGSLTQSPPAWASRASRLIKRALRVERLPLLDAIRAINSAKGYATKPPSQQVLLDIEQYFEAYNHRLREYIWRP